MDYLEKPAETPGNSKVVKFSIVLVFLLLLISVLGFSIFSKDLIGNLQISKKQINSLIDEMGTVKEENRILSEVIEGLEGKVDGYSENLKGSAEEESAEQSIEQPPQNKILYLKGGQFKDINELDFIIVGHHDGLTDTIILASINQKLETVSFLSVPRDLYIDGRKINEFYEFYGIEKLIEEVAKATGVQAEKYMVVDMDTFTKMIDLIGGIDVNVEKDIYDYSYPDDKGYSEPYSIQKGDYHMNGTEALKYARSRKSTSDFDRSERQQDIIEAVRKQIKEADYLNKVRDLVSIYTVLIKDLETNVDILETVTYLKKFQDYKFETGNVLSNENFLYSLINQSGAYILLPKDGDYENIKSFVKDLIEK